jgi:hypothetical protein
MSGDDPGAGVEPDTVVAQVRGERHVRTVVDRFVDVGEGDACESCSLQDLLYARRVGERERIRSPGSTGYWPCGCFEGLADRLADRFSGRDRPAVRRGAVHRRGDRHHVFFATQDKVWVSGPAGEKWEVYTVLADSETFGTSPQHLEESGEGEDGVCCGGTAAVEAGQPARTFCC